MVTRKNDGSCLCNHLLICARLLAIEKNKSDAEVKKIIVGAAQASIIGRKGVAECRHIDARPRNLDERAKACTYHFGAAQVTVEVKMVR